MKKQKLKSLALKKKTISELTYNSTSGGAISGGCTDGCGIFVSYWNCTMVNCSQDCTSKDTCDGPNTGALNSCTC